MTEKQTARTLDGRILAEDIKLKLARKIAKEAHQPSLAVVLIGSDKASSMYISLKEKACKEVGIDFHKYLCTDNASEQEVLDAVSFLNKDDSIDGILLQLPLPKGFDTQKIINTIDKSKDVDGFLSTGLKEEVVPPTISAIIELLKSTGVDLKDKKILAIAKSDIYTNKIEKYLAVLNPVSIKTSSDIPSDAKDYDVIIIALGQPSVLKGDMVKKGAVVIDVGINKVDGKIVGDVDPSVNEKASYVSPVPRGVGPLTVACLLRNTFELSQKNNYKIIKAPLL